MAWRGPNSDRDPLLVTPQHRANRRHWQRLRLPCARCGKPIAYDQPTFFVVNGKRIMNPLALHVGHIVPRWRAKQLGWTPAQTNALSNSQPEHARCSVRAGARDGNRVQRPLKRRVVVDSSRRW
jgi:hypothetical protein